ncbi:MAG: DUF2905 domain-containing protein [Candidatus Omnitrophota bacterium]
MPALGKLLIILGIALIACGVFLYFVGKIPFLGRLPGDIYVEKGKLTFYFPLVTCIFLSLFLSLVFWFFPRH